MDELRKLRENHFVNQSVIRQLSSASSLDNNSHSESLHYGKSKTAEYKDLEIDVSQRDCTGRLKPRLFINFNPDALNQSKDSTGINKTKVEGTPNFQKRRLDFNPEIKKTLTNQLRKPNQTDLINLRKEMISRQLQAIKPVKTKFMPSSPLNKPHGNTEQEVILQPWPFQSQGCTKLKYSESAKLFKKPHSRQPTLMIPQFKSFSSDHSLSLLASKRADYPDNDGSERDSESFLPEEGDPRKAPASTDIQESKFEPFVTPDDLLLTRCRQMMTELQENKKESDELRSRLFKFKVFEFDPVASEKFKISLLDENCRLNTKLTETKAQYMIAQKKYDTSVSKLERARQSSLALFEKKRDLEMKKALQKIYQAKLADVQAKIVSFKTSLGHFRNTSEMEKTQLIQAMDLKWRGTVLDSICCLVRDSACCSDEEGALLFDSIANLKEKLSLP